MNTLLNIQDLSISFRQGAVDTHIVKSVDLQVRHHQTVALVGESGSGKSLTAHAIMRLLPYPCAFHPSGNIVFDQCDLLSLPLTKMTHIRGNRIGMIFQEPMSALNPLHTVEQQISEVLHVHQVNDKQQVLVKLSKKILHEQVITLLKQVKIPNPESKMNAYPHELSGGQRQRVMIAMALANRPQLLIADEPTTALDVTVQKDILDLLKQLQKKYEMGLLLITHDLGVVKYMADHVYVMKQGEIVEQGNTLHILNHPEHDYTKQLINSEPSGQPVQLEDNDTSSPLLCTRDLQVSFPLSKPLFGRCKNFFHALNHVDIELYEGATLGVLGESGSGKSTLALAVLRLVQSEGSINYNDINISSLSEKAFKPYRCEMQIVFQDPFSSLSPRMSVQQIISEGLHLQRNMDESQIDQAVIAIMQEVGLEPEMRHRYPHEFSGGQRQRISIARALIVNPRLLFLDEPTSALDRTVQMQVIELLRKLQKTRKLSYVFISHDISVVKALSHQIIVIKNGKIVEQGDADTVLNTPSHPYTKTLLSAALQ
ncbi:ABC transporter ATP-binding protein [Eionea flava]